MQVLRGHKGPVRDLEYAADGRSLASVGDDRTVRLWDLNAGRVHTLGHHEDDPTCVAFDANSRMVASAGFCREVHLWGSGGTVTLAPRAEGAITELDFSPDGKWLAAGMDVGRTAIAQNVSTLLLWDLSGSSQRLALAAAWPSVWSLAFAPDGRWLATGLGNGCLRLWEMNPFAQRFEVPHSGGVRTVAFSPDGRTLAAGHSADVQLWDVKASTPGPLLLGRDHYVWSIAFSPDGRFLATGGWDSTVRVWDVATGLEQRRYDWQLGRVNGVDFAPDGRTAAAAGQNGDIIIWDVDDLYW